MVAANYLLHLRKKAHVFELDGNGVCVLCGLVRNAECHAFYSYMEAPALQELPIVYNAIVPGFNKSENKSK